MRSFGVCSAGPLQDYDGADDCAFILFIMCSLKCRRRGLNGKDIQPASFFNFHRHAAGCTETDIRQCDSGRADDCGSRSNEGRHSAARGPASSGSARQALPDPDPQLRLR